MQEEGNVWLVTRVLDVDFNLRKLIYAFREFIPEQSYMFIHEGRMYCDVRRWGRRRRLQQQLELNHCTCDCLLLIHFCDIIVFELCFGWATSGWRLQCEASLITRLENRVTVIKTNICKIMQLRVQWFIYPKRGHRKRSTRQGGGCKDEIDDNEQQLCV